MNIWIALVIGIFIGCRLGVLLGSILAAAGQSYSGPVAPDDRERGALS